MTIDLRALAAELTRVPVASEKDLALLAGMVKEQADRQAICNLNILYARAVDDRDIDTLVGMYTPDGVFDRRGTRAEGSEAIRAAYVSSFHSYRTTLHSPHPGVTQMRSDGTASGWSHGHAELVTRGVLVLASFRYEDDYRCIDGRWMFARRSLTFMYAVPADEMAGSFDGVDRMRWPGVAPEAADYPESSLTWSSYRK